MLWNKERVMLREEMKFEDIIKKRDVRAGLHYLYRRTSTIRQQQVIEMIEHELQKREEKNND